jgi:quercetin dioxygenase-like cupin family protein
MRFKPDRFYVHVTNLLLIAGFLSLGLLVGMQTGDVTTAVGHTPVISQALPDDPGRSLTAVQVELAPEAKVASHHHPGIVFAYVLEGIVRSQLNDDKAIDYHTGQYWVEPPGTRHTLTENPSATRPARLLAVFIAPTGATLTIPDT